MKPSPLVALALAAGLAGLTGCLSPQRPPGDQPRYGWVADPDQDPATPPPERFPAAVTSRRGGRAMGAGPAAAAAPGDGVPRGSLLARDGSVVADPVPGGVTKNDVLAHDMQPTATGRMYILELYQQAIDDRDALELEVGSLTRALEQRDAANEALRAKLVGKDAELGTAQAEIQGLLEENQDLAARLATAQIRRLEAERMLLETKLEWLKAQRAAAESAAQAPADAQAPAKSTAKPAAKPGSTPPAKTGSTVPGP